MSVSIHKMDHSIECVYESTCLVADIANASALIQADQDVGSLNYIIHDFSKVIHLEAGAIAIAAISSKFASTKPNIRVAMIMSEHMANSSNARIHAGAARRQTQVFDDRAAAIRWAEHQPTEFSNSTLPPTGKVKG